MTDMKFIYRVRNVSPIRISTEAAENFLLSKSPSEGSRRSSSRDEIGAVYPFESSSPKTSCPSFTVTVGLIPLSAVS